MELNKLEKQFREKLKEREIMPSQNSWNRLDAMLPEVETKPKRNYNWLFVAASLIGFFFIGTFFFSQSDELIDQKRNNVVFENKGNVVQKKSQIIISSKTQSLVEISKEKKKKNNPNNSKTTLKNNIIIVQNTKSSSDLKSDTKQEIQKVNSLNQDYTEVDELLAAVKVNSKNQNPKMRVKIDAKNLLSEADGELELSFREKAINTLNRNYHNIKVALSNRNTTTKTK